MSVPQGRRVVLLSLLGSILLTLQTQSYPLYVAVGGSLLLGTAYSAEPLRLKRWPFAAALCISLVRCVAAAHHQLTSSPPSAHE
jgi:homogentisate phytyltransferase / homogentisate geranylgeranyltransferase